MDYQIRTNSKARRLILRLDASGKPVVTVPRFTPKFFVEKFVKAHEDWIKTHSQQLNKAKNHFRSAEAVSLFGKEYELITKPTNSTSKVVIQGKKLIVTMHHGKTTNQILDQWLKNTASHYLVPRVHQLAEKMKLSFNTITLRAQTTRWGSCSSTNNLNFNWKLVHFKPEIIDSVIIHELAHLTHHNHSRDFWQLVAKFDPAYKLHNGWLKRQGIGVV